jgi:phosphatidylglycerophosphate synthase
VFGATVAVLTLFYKMERFDVSRLGKWATFILMFVFPGFVMGSSGIPGDWFFTGFAWIAGPIGLGLSYYTAWQYLPAIQSSLQRRGVDITQ